MTVSGMYFSFGDLRKTALQMAIDSAEDFTTESVVDRAEAYFRFLAGERTHDQI